MSCTCSNDDLSMEIVCNGKYEFSVQAENRP